MLTPELTAIYLDAEENLMFKEELLKEMEETQLPNQGFETVNPQLEQVETITRKPLSTIMKDTALEKFVPKSTNASSWIEIFESECSRLDVSRNHFCKAIHLFLEDSAVDWYKFARVELKTTDWEKWQGTSNSRVSFHRRFTLKIRP